MNFNPILCKTGSDNHSELIIRGQVHGIISTIIRDFRAISAAQLQDLRERFDLVSCEGSESAAEINLRSTNIANFNLTREAQIPVYIVGDTPRGGVLAHLFGTQAIISDEYRNLIREFVINKFRGGHTLLNPGLAKVEVLIGVETKETIPFIEVLWRDPEDSFQMNTGGVMASTVGQKPVGHQRLDIAAIQVPQGIQHHRY